ncbi:hypothetical protein N7462_011135 [Penicillium macrosclerotiorum]|uniref:uncharacterized protein n=1 Tax=Penicillium macrosclerotiorum TaxID=303699 RepID=UPI0025494080|nr:uncharacterized protein N7462_011135 [Penicillium macrosclerotiorum]KAJ5666726.1 hypothetical protein N7462_011135 [Penicillium macrosclerotiorum]
MRPPEMSYSPAYHQAQDSLGAAARQSILAPLPRRSLDPPQPSHPAPRRPSNDSPGVPVSPRSSTRGSHTYSPETPHRVSRMDEDSTATRIVASGGIVHKEERSPGSWTDRPSLMSAEHSGTIRAHKRSAVPEVPAVESQDALLMIFRLSVPVPIYSFAACIYTCCALIFALLISPLRLCPPTPYLRNTSLKSQLCDLLAPALHTHERLVHLRPPAAERSSSTQWIHADLESDQSPPLGDLTRCYAVGASILILILSPLLSIAILLCAWTAASFWVFAMVMGNPDGTERKDDGRAAVLGVCKWWQTWLCKARKPS